MTNSNRSSVSFAYGGETLNYKISTNALCRFEDLMGETMLRAADHLSVAGQGDGLDTDFRRLRAMFWAGLPTTITVEDAGDMVDDLGKSEVVEIISKGLALAFPDAEEAEGNAPKPKKAAPKA